MGKDMGSTKKKKKKTKSSNPNLKLVKNGDAPVKKKKKADSGKTVKKSGSGKAARKKSASPGEWFAQHRSLFLIGLTICVVVTILCGIYYYAVTEYKVTTVYVDGNVHYTNEEVMNMVMTGTYGNNSLFLAFKYKDKGIENIPFVEKMDINILDPNTIRINVYEKALAGYVEYLGMYMYFDKDGIVVESSHMKTTGIPQVTGLHFDYVVLNEPLPVENDEIFQKILNITQLLAKYELTADKIFFDSDYNLTLHFDGVRVALGGNNEIDEKIMRLQYILPKLEGKSGTLRMENHTEDTKNTTFDED